MSERITEDSQGNLVVQRALVEELNGIRTEQAKGFAELRTSLEAKADSSDIARIETSLAHHEAERRRDSERINALEGWRQSEQQAAAIHEERATRTLTRRQKIGAGVVAVVAAVGVYIEPVITSAVSHGGH